LPVVREPVSNQGITNGSHGGSLDDADREANCEALVLDERKGGNGEPPRASHFDKSLGVGLKVIGPLGFEGECGGACASYNGGWTNPVGGDVVESSIKRPMSHEGGGVGKKSVGVQLGNCCVRVNITKRSKMSGVKAYW